MRTLGFALAALVLACCAEDKPVPDASATGLPKVEGADARVLETRPTLPPIKAFQTPQPQQDKLPNGLTVITVERPGDPLETVLFITIRGSDADGPTPGVASITSEMLQAGSANRSANQIADEINAMGASLDAEANRDGQIYGLTVLPSQLGAAVSLLGDITLAPNFDPKEFDRVKAKRLASLVAQASEPGVLASLAFQAATYGEGPYGHPGEGTEASIQKMTLDDVKKFYGTMLAGDCAVIAAGGIPTAQVKALIAARFAVAKPGSSGAPAVPMPTAAGPKLILIDKPDAPQSVLRYGEAGPEVPSLEDRVADELFNTILGGSFTSRLNQNLREKHGYSYGASSWFGWSRHGGPWGAQASVKADVTGDAIHEMQAEVSTLLDQGLTPEELSKAKALSVEGLVELLEGSSGTAAAFAHQWQMGMPLDELSHLIPTLDQLTLPKIKAAVSKAIDPQRLTLVVVGAAATVEPQLAKVGLGAAERWVVEGHQAHRAEAATGQVAPAKAGSKKPDHH